MPYFSLYHMGNNVSPQRVLNKQHKDILIVEDDSDLLEIYRVILEADSWNIIATETCKDACLKLLGDRRVPDIVVLDLGLPDCDGIEILKTIQKGGIQIHVIVVSACGDIQKAIACVQAGAVEFIEKPIEPKKFLDIINKYHYLPKQQTRPVDKNGVGCVVSPDKNQVTPKPMDAVAADSNSSLPVITERRSLTRTHLYIFIAIVIALFLTGAYAMTEYLENQSNKRTEALRMFIAESVRILETNSHKRQSLDRQIIEGQGVQTRKMVDKLTEAMQTNKEFASVVRAINKYKKKKSLSTIAHFKRFYLLYFARVFWHVKPEIFIQALRELHIPEHLIPGNRATLLKMKKAHIFLLKRFRDHIKNAEYPENIVPKEDRSYNTYRTGDDIDYGKAKVSEKKQKKLVRLLKKYIDTYKLGDSEGKPKHSLTVIDAE